MNSKVWFCEKIFLLEDDFGLNEAIKRNYGN